MTLSPAELAALGLIGFLGHAAALFWYRAAQRGWRICSRVIYDMPIPAEQLRREWRNSLHAPIHAVLLGLVLRLGFFENTSVLSFVGCALATTVWAELWHYASHRAMHLKPLHWIHKEHHKSHLNSHLTAISFSFSEKLIFDIGLLAPFLLVDGVLSVNVFGVAAWYVGYLLINSYSHANFEPKAEGYNQWLGKVLTSTTYHSLHHSRYIGNYGLGTRVLDRVFGTEWPDYEPLYHQVTAERRPLKRLSEKASDATTEAARTQVS